MRKLLSICFFGLSLLAFSQNELKNIILITLDDLGNQLGYLGDKYARTPHLDALAIESVVFTNAYVTQSSCSPSRASILTSLYPNQHEQIGLANENSIFSISNEVSSILPNILKKEGFKTYYAGKLHINPESAFHFDDHFLNPEQTRDYQKVNELIENLFKDRRGKKFFMLNLYDPHTNIDKVFPSQINGIPQITFKSEDVSAFPFQLVYDESQIKRIADYYSAVSRADFIIGEIIKYLKENTLFDSSLIIIVSDNGPPFNRAKTSCYEAGVKVPLIIKPPQSKSSQSIESLVTLNDIMPSILDYANIKCKRNLQGQSLKLLIEGKKTYIRDQIITEFNYHHSQGFYPRRSIRIGDWKLIHNLDTTLKMPFPSVDFDQSSFFVDKYEPKESDIRSVFNTYLNPPKYELYDLSVDPHELSNLVYKKEYIDAFDNLREALLEWQFLSNPKNNIYRENSFHEAALLRSDLEVTYDLLDSLDNKHFEITEGNKLYFKNNPDYENPTDLDSNNDYEVMLRITANNGGMIYKKLSFKVVDDGLSNNEQEKLYSISIYPNPSEGYVYLNGIDLSKLTIYSSNGQLLRTLPLEKYYQKIDTSTLPSGVLYFQITLQDGARITRTIINL